MLSKLIRTRISKQILSPSQRGIILPKKGQNITNNLTNHSGVNAQTNPAKKHKTLYSNALNKDQPDQENFSEKRNQNQSLTGDPFKAPVPGTIPSPSNQKQEYPSKVPQPEVGNRRGQKEGVYDVPDVEKHQKPQIEKNPAENPSPERVQVGLGTSHPGILENNMRAAEGTLGPISSSGGKI
eukprot:403364243